MRRTLFDQAGPPAPLGFTIISFPDVPGPLVWEPTDQQRANIEVYDRGRAQDALTSLNPKEAEDVVQDFFVAFIEKELCRTGPCGRPRWRAMPDSAFSNHGCFPTGPISNHVPNQSHFQPHLAEVEQSGRERLDRRAVLTPNSAGGTGILPACLVVRPTASELVFP